MISPHKVQPSRRSVFLVPASASTSYLIPHLLELFPLFGRQDLLQFFISLLSNSDNPRVSFLAQRLQLPASIAEYLLDLRLLVAVELQPINHLRILLSTCLIAAAPPLVDIQSQGARRKAQQENKYGRDANSPFAVANLFHSHFTTSSSVS